MPWRWFRDWRERRSALRDLDTRQRNEEAMLLDIELNPINVAKLSLNSGDPVRAAAQWERARQVLPNAVLRSPDSLEILLGLKRYDEADQLYREGRRRFPRDRRYLIGLAQIAEARGDMPEAALRWMAVRDAATGDVVGYLGCARCLTALERYDEAESHFDQVIRRDPDNLDAWVGRARVSHYRGDWPESLARWKQLAEQRGFGPAFAFVAKAMAELGQLEEAYAYLDEPFRLFPLELEVSVTRAILARTRGDLDAECHIWETIRSVAPYFTPGYHEGVYCLVEAGRHDEADAVRRDALERFSDQAWPWLDFARLAHNRGDWHEAAARWNEALRRFPEDETAIAGRADALARAAQQDRENVPDREA